MASYLAVYAIAQTVPPYPASMDTIPLVGCMLVGTAVQALVLPMAIWAFVRRERRGIAVAAILTSAPWLIYIAVALLS